MPQAEHRQIVESTEHLETQQIVELLSPIQEQEVKYQYERRLYEHGLGPTPSTTELRTESTSVC